MESLNIALLGPSGAGKGTHAAPLCSRFDLEHLSMGDLLRDNLERGTILGLSARSYMERGELVPDEVVDGIIEERIRSAPASEGLLLDGFPRRCEQAMFLQEALLRHNRELDAVIYLRASEDEIVHRLTGRLLCRDCHEPYHAVTHPPARHGVCDDCGGKVAARPDDTEEMARKRFRVFKRHIFPALDYYQKRGLLHIVNAARPMRTVFDELSLLMQAIKVGGVAPASPGDLQVLTFPRRIGASWPVDGLNFVLLGAPGSGKGTQADTLGAEFGLLHVASGDLFRENLKKETELGRLAKTYMNRGELVPDDITESMIEERLGRTDTSDGFILDGFPRTLPQAEALSEMLVKLDRPLAGVLYLRVPDDSLVERVSGRWICRNCQTPYHLSFKPPARPGICDKCNGALYQRDDDKPETVRARLRTFHKQTEPLIDFYKGANLLWEIDGEGGVHEVSERVTRAVRELRDQAWESQDRIEAAIT